MANYNDYELEDAENAAVQKSKNLKRGLAAGAAVAGVGSVSYGATKMADHTAQNEESELTSEDLLAGAEAGTDGIPEQPTETHTTVEHHVHIHHDPKPEPEPIPEPATEMEVEETAFVYDENGDLVTVYDTGTFEGKSFMVMDIDGNGKGDIIAYDENNNGEFEENEISYLDNETYELGQGKNLVMYQENHEGEVELIGVRPNPLLEPMAQNENNSRSFHNDDDIHNDFEDEKTGEVYSRDLAENNPDYNNHDRVEQYSAHANNQEMELTDLDSGERIFYSEENHIENFDHPTGSYEDPNDSHLAYGDDYDTNNSYDGVPDYGYTEPNDDFASFDGGSDSYDEAASYDA